MEPAKAAAIMEKLKLETVVKILRNMKGKAAGRIVAMMSPEKGAKISEALSREQ
jgi:flagellar motility protein MotE (MotC chaperone)